MNSRMKMGCQENSPVRRQTIHAMDARSIGLTAVILLGLVAGCAPMPETNDPQVWAELSGEYGRRVQGPDRKQRADYLVATRLFLIGQADQAQTHWEKHLDVATPDHGNRALNRRVVDAEKMLWIAMGHAFRGNRALAEQGLLEAGEVLQDVATPAGKKGADIEAKWREHAAKNLVAGFYENQSAMAAAIRATEVTNRANEHVGVLLGVRTDQARAEDIGYVLGGKSGWAIRKILTIEDDEERASRLLTVVLVQGRLGQTDGRKEALDHLTRFYTLSEWAQGHVHLLEGDIEDALQAAREYRHFPDLEVELLCAIAEACHQAGQDDVAREVIGEALEGVEYITHPVLGEQELPSDAGTRMDLAARAWIRIAVAQRRQPEQAIATLNRIPAMIARVKRIGDREIARATRPRYAIGGEAAGAALGMADALGSLFGGRSEETSLPTPEQVRATTKRQVNEIVSLAESAYGRGCRELATQLARSGDREGLKACLWNSRSDWGRSMIYLGACDGFLLAGLAVQEADGVLEQVSCWLTGWSHSLSKL
jgi:tetratricopeptide (TPR) repeat protein